MGLFSNNKKLCPVCGAPTPKLLPTKVDGTPICKACAGKVDLPEGMLKQMSVESFAEYIAFYDHNQPLRDTFQETYTYSQGFLKAETPHYELPTVPGASRPGKGRNGRGSRTAGNGDADRRAAAAPPGYPYRADE